MREAAVALRAPGNAKSRLVNVNIDVTVMRTVETTRLVGGKKVTTTEIRPEKTTLAIQVARDLGDTPGEMGTITSWWLSETNMSNPLLRPEPPKNGEVSE